MKNQTTRSEVLDFLKSMKINPNEPVLIGSGRKGYSIKELLTDFRNTLSLRGVTEPKAIKEIAEREWKCEKCTHLKQHTLQSDEVGGGNSEHYCAKKHWHGGDSPNENEPDPWKDCKDYE